MSTTNWPMTFEGIKQEWVDHCLKDTTITFFSRLDLDSRLSRLFAVACCREIWEYMTCESSRRAVEVAELAADNEIPRSVLVAAYSAANADCIKLGTYSRPPDRRVEHAALCAALVASPINFRDVGVIRLAEYAAVVAFSANQWHRHHARPMFERQGSILASMVAPELRFNPDWRTTTVVNLARVIYKTRAQDLMPILADALQDAGCEEPSIIEYLRNSTIPFYRGNRIVDQILGNRI